MSTHQTPLDTDAILSALKLLRDWLQATRGNPPSFYIANAGPARDAGLRLWERTSAAIAAISGNGRDGRGEAPGSAPESSSGLLDANGGVSGEDSEWDTRRADISTAQPLRPSLAEKDSPTEQELTLSNHILEAIQLSDEAGGESGLSKSDILSLLDSTPTDSEWAVAISYLVSEGKVRREGVKRGTRYFLADSEGDTQ